MPHIQDQQGNYLIRLDINTEIMSELQRWAKQYGHSAGSFQAIGALKEAELGFYHLHEKTYEKKVFKDEMELISLHGNLSLVDGEPFVHIHVSLGDSEFKVWGGHLFSAKVAVTCEVFFRPFKTEGTVVREFNEQIGLKHLCFIEKRG